VTSRVVKQSHLIDSIEDNADEVLGKREMEIMGGISPEKALQYNVVLQDINQKISRVSWKAL